MLGVYSLKNFDIFSIIYRLLVRKKKIQSLVVRRARRCVNCFRHNFVVQVSKVNIDRIDEPVNEEL